MKFDFVIQNHDEEREQLIVRFTPEHKGLGIIRKRFSLTRDDDGKWPGREDILRMIRTNAPIQQWQRKATALAHPAEDMAHIIDLVGYEESGVRKPAKSRIGTPQAFPNEAVI